MAYRRGTFDRVFLVRWTELVLPDLDIILREMRARRDALARPLIYVSIIAESAPVPSSAEREGLRNFGTKSKAVCEGAYIIIEGGSVKHSLQRTVLTGLMFLAQEEGFYFRVHKDFHEVALKIGATTAIDPVLMETEFRKQGLI
jgi:hypothetical protein